jgi:hypothetical protein
MYIICISLNRRVLHQCNPHVPNPFARPFQGNKRTCIFALPEGDKRTREPPYSQDKQTITIRRLPPSPHRFCETQNSQQGRFFLFPATVAFHFKFTTVPTASIARETWNRGDTQDSFPCLAWSLVGGAGVGVGNYQTYWSMFGILFAIPMKHSPPTVQGGS